MIADSTKKRSSHESDSKAASQQPSAAKGKNTRREELLKQLRAVEDAIARKRKLN